MLCSCVSTLERLKMREWKTRDGRKVTLENPKPSTRITEFNKTYDILPIPLSLKLSNSALRHQCRYVIQFKLIIILITTFSQCSRYLCNSYTAVQINAIRMIIIRSKISKRMKKVKLNQHIFISDSI